MNLRSTCAERSLKCSQLQAADIPEALLSATDIIAVLFHDEMNIDPQDPHKPDRDRFVLSKGHAAPALYAALALLDFFPIEELSQLQQAR